jgi:hypothetical protein
MRTPPIPWLGGFDGSWTTFVALFMGVIVVATRAT